MIFFMENKYSFNQIFADLFFLDLRNFYKVNEGCVTLSRVTGGCFCHVVRVGQKVHN